MDYALTGNDLLQNATCNAKLMIYKDIHKYDTVEELFGDNDAIFILYETSPNVGHWTLLFRINNKIEFYDSYNYRPDAQFEFIDEDFKRNRNMNYPYLIKLLLDYAERGGEVHYNEFKLQREGGNIATCGRHCLIRLMWRGLPIKQYYHLLKDLKGELGLKSFDDVVLALTDDIRGD